MRVRRAYFTFAVYEEIKERKKERKMRIRQTIPEVKYLREGNRLSGGESKLGLLKYKIIYLIEGYRLRGADAMQSG